MRLIGAGGTVVGGVVVAVVAGVVGVVVGVADVLATGAVVDTTVGDGGEVTTEFDAEPCEAFVVVVGALTVVVGALVVVVGVVIGAVDILVGTLSSVDTTDDTGVKSVSEFDDGSSEPHPNTVANIKAMPPILTD